MKLFLYAIIITSLTQAAHAALNTKTVLYQDGSAILEGYVAFDDATTGEIPGVILAPDWMGPSSFIRNRAEGLARMGYKVLVADLYGKDVRPKNNQEAAQLKERYKADLPLLRSRMKAGLNQLLDEPRVDPDHIAVVGYGFGGTAALELARSGAHLAGIVVYHGELDTPNPNDAKNIKGKVMVFTGSDDPYIPPEQVTAFENEMRQADVDWQLVRYGGAVHSFTNPTIGPFYTNGVAYNGAADRRSWQLMKEFFSEVFREKYDLTFNPILPIPSGERAPD